MGYALFTARKLTLTARVNDLNAQLMSISNQQTAIANKISATQNTVNYRNVNSQSKAAQDFAAAIAGGQDYTVAFADYQTALSDISLLSTENDMSINILKAKENALDMQRNSIQTMLTAATNELESVKSAEEKAIKNSIIKF